MCIDWIGQACRQIAELASSSIFGCRVGCEVGEAMFSTMIEPSAVNTSREVHLTGSRDGTSGQVLARWKKDDSPMRYSYGNAFLPDGENSTRYLAATTIAVETDDLVTTLWEVESHEPFHALALLSAYLPRLPWFRAKPVDVLA